MTEKKIYKIVITGGPCAGKSTAMSWIQNAFTELGYTVLFVPETATEFITGGVAPWTCGTNVDYQKCQMELQLKKEELFERAANTMNADKLLIVCDRGAMDNRAYMDAQEFAEVLSFLGRSETELRDGYDAVFHLVTAAKGAEEFYTTANNAARYESAEDAVQVDDNLIASWTGHPHLRIIGNDTDFEKKMMRLITEISIALGEPEPYETERKYLIKYPDLRWLEALPSCKKVEITQTYLISPEGEERRVRKRGSNGSYIYYRTVKKKITDMRRLETEERLSEEEYKLLLEDADPARQQISKDRYCLTLDNKYYEVDVYPFWQDKAILEIEISDENEEVQVPEVFHVIREVTEDKRFSNSSLAAGSYRELTKE